MTHENYLKYCKNFGMIPEFEKFTVENAIIDSFNQKIYSQIVDWPTTGIGFYLQGPPGTGKTFALALKANLLFKEKIRTIVNRMSDHRYPQWINLCDYVVDTSRNNSFDTTHDDKAEKIESDAENADWLFVDDFGATTQTPTVLAKVFKLLDARAQNGKQTFISSNFDMNEVRNFYGDRVYSRACGITDFIKLEGPDRRRAR